MYVGDNDEEISGARADNGTDGGRGINFDAITFHCREKYGMDSKM